MNETQFVKNVCKRHGLEFKEFEGIDIRSRIFEEGRKEGAIAELENVLKKSIWISNKDNLLVMHMPELRQYLRNRLKELGGETK